MASHFAAFPLRRAGAVARAAVALAAALAAAPAAAAEAPPCHSPLNPALETICSKTVKTEGNFTLRDLAVGVNVSLVTATTDSDNGDWQFASTFVTQYVLEYFTGANQKGQRVATTVPLIYRWPGGPAKILASMALPTSVFPDPGLAPAPDVGVFEPFPPIRVLALSFVTAVAATDTDYALHCGEVAQKAADSGLTPVAGAWEQAWVTYSGRDAAQHVNECWVQVKAT